MTEIFSQYQERNYIHQALAPVLLSTTKRTQLADKLLLACRHFLQERVHNQPQPPANWSRQVPSTTAYKKQWQLLKAFMESPDKQVFDYRKNQSERNELEMPSRTWWLI